MTSDKARDVGEVKALLESFLKSFGQYSAEVFGDRRQDLLDKMRADLQRREPAITNYLLQIVGDGVIYFSSFGRTKQMAHHSLLHLAVIGGNNEMEHNFREYDNCVTSLLNRALGSIDAGLWPPEHPQPVLTINDQVLKDRCLELLSSSGKFDRVVREATLILEERLRNKIPHERLTELIPESAKQTGEQLVNTLLSPGNPVLSVSTDQRERAAFHRVMLGVFAYLRNPFHHRIDDTLEWSWAWSIVGFIDHLLHELDSAEELET